MKKMKWFALGISVLILFAGCALTSSFNKTYMPAAVPDKPADKISLSADDSRVVSKYISQKTLSNYIGLFWLTTDTIYVNLEDSAIFSVNVKTKSAQELQGNEAGEARKSIAQKTDIKPDDEGRGVVRQFAASVFSYMGHKFSGDLTDNGQKIGVEIKTFENRDPSNASRCESMKLKGQLTNSKGKKTDVELDYDCAWGTQVYAFKKVPQLLSRFQVSPSGKHYLYGSRLYSVEKNVLVGDLLNNYSGTVAVSANPDWSKIAVLRGQGKSYWVEVFDLQIK